MLLHYVGHELILPICYHLSSKTDGTIEGTLVHGAFLDDVFARPHCIVNELTNLLLAEDVLEIQ